MDKQQFTGAIFIDLKKALMCDVVSHDYLLHKLDHYGVRDGSLDWFQGYLTTLTQKVTFGKDLSSSSSVEYGVYTGTVTFYFIHQ